MEQESPLSALFGYAPIVDNIFMKLTDFNDKLNVMLVCKHWKNMMCSRSVFFEILRTSPHFTWSVFYVGHSEMELRILSQTFHFFLIFPTFRTANKSTHHLSVGARAPRDPYPDTVEPSVLLPRHSRRHKSDIGVFVNERQVSIDDVGLKV